MNIQKLMQQAQAMQQRIEEAQNKLEDEEAEGSSGGGMVRVVLNGKGNLRSVSIDEKLMDPSEKEMLEDLIVAAFNDGKDKIERLVAEKMKGITAGMGLPPGMKLPF